MKNATLAATAALLVGAHAAAGTYTWTGATGDGLWSTAGNWDYDDGNGGTVSPAAASPGNNVAHDVAISGAGVEVLYVPGGDLVTRAGTRLTVSDGAKLAQNGGAWPMFNGDVVVDGGTIDFSNNESNPDQTRLAGVLSLRNGGSLLTRQLVKVGDARVVIGSGVTFTVEGTLGADYSTMYQTMDGGTLFVAGEFQAKNGNVYTGSGTISANIFSPQAAGSAVTFDGPDLVLRTGSFDGFWQAGGTYVNVPAGSTSRFTIMSGFKNADDVYPKTFGSSATTPKFRYNGEVIDRATFDELFTVEPHGEAIDGDSNYADFFLTPKETGAFSFADGFVYATLTDDTAATLSATVANAGDPASGIVAVYGTTDPGRTLDGWDHVVDLGAAAAGAVSASIALDPGRLYYYRLVATNGTDEVWASPSPASIYSMMEPGAPTNVWTGAVSTDSREAGNWSLGHVPAASETVFVFDRLHGARLDWHPGTGTDEVAGWVQPADFADAKHQVFFHTEKDAPLVVSGDVLLGAGTWTHGGPADEPEEMVNVFVGGSMEICAGARIVAGTAANYNDTDGAPRGYSQDHGPGYLRTAGGSFAGEGGHVTNTAGFVSYGSILDPLSYGSGGHGDSANYGGGGIVKLEVAGALAVDGLVCSRGFGYPVWGREVVGGAGSGGSVNIVAGSLSGTGRIDADGGNNGGYGPGSGGRVKIELSGAGSDFGGFSGTIQAVGGEMQNAADASAYDVSPAAAGTVCLQAAGSDPVVKVRNVFRYAGVDAGWRVASGEAVPSATHLPAMQDGDSPSALLRTEWELSGHGALRLVRDVRVLSLSLESDDGSQRVYTEGRVLAVKTLSIAGTALRSGEYKAADLPGIVVGSGSVVVDVMPTVVVIR